MLRKEPFIVLYHIFPDAKSTSNKVKHKKNSTPQFLPQFFIPFQGVGAICFVAIEKLLIGRISTNLKVGSEAKSHNKT